MHIRKIYPFSTTSVNNIKSEESKSKVGRHPLSARTPSTPIPRGSEQDTRKKLKPAKYMNDLKWQGLSEVGCPEFK